MDEAERCHALAYIAYGKLLAHGTVREVIDAGRICPPGRSTVADLMAVAARAAR